MSKIFGPMIFGQTIGEVWLKLTKHLALYGDDMPDERRDRKAVQCVVVKALTQELPDKLIDKYGKKKNVDDLVKMTFEQEYMQDFDVVQNFSDGPKSYYGRIKEGKLLDYVVERLSEIPESKKGIIVFPEWKDCEEVLRNQYDDYFPCLISVQFRMIEQEDKSWVVNTIFNMRSSDVYQKLNGNMVAMAMLTKEVATRVSKNIGKNIKMGYMQGFITDAHIYGETIEEAKKIIEQCGL